MKLRFLVHAEAVHHVLQDVLIDGAKIAARVPTQVIQLVAINHSQGAGALKLQFVERRHAERRAIGAGLPDGMEERREKDRRVANRFETGKEVVFELVEPDTKEERNPS
jgi:hypothetical protein